VQQLDMSSRAVADAERRTINTPAAAALTNGVI
jgi:hypothetical protein